MARDSRSLRGERGLKFLSAGFKPPAGLSLPTRGAWIEIYLKYTFVFACFGRSLRGERGLKFVQPHQIETFVPVAPYAGSVD